MYIYVLNIISLGRSPARPVPFRHPPNLHTYENTIKHQLRVDTCLLYSSSKSSQSVKQPYVNDVHPESVFFLILFISFQVLLAFICLIVGFALSFSVLFHGNDQFHDTWRALVKTVVMMMGEYEYGDLFSDEMNQRDDTNGEKNFLHVTGRIVFLIFVVLASIVLMNLMIGLAVNDIQGLEKEVSSREGENVMIIFIYSPTYFLMKVSTFLVS